MAILSDDEMLDLKMLYLLYAEAYSEKTTSDLPNDSQEKFNEIYRFTVTKGTIRKCIQAQYKEKSDDIYNDLLDQKFITPTDPKGNPTNKPGRFSLTKEGKAALVSYLANTKNKFTSSKGHKVLNALQRCIKYAVLNKSNQAMNYEDFREKFKEIYFQERKRQSLRGVVLILKNNLMQTFIIQNNISMQEFDKYFDLLENRGAISITQGKEDQIIQWVE